MNAVHICLEEAVLEAQLGAEVFAGCDVVGVTVKGTAHAIDLNIALVAASCLAAASGLCFCAHGLQLRKPVGIQSKTPVDACDAVVAVGELAIGD